MPSLPEYLRDAATRDALASSTLEHVVVTGVPVALALLLGVGLGVLAHRRPATRTAVTTTTATFLTLPSLALFAVFIPFVGIGYASTIVPLTLYALLPIVRTTVVGLAHVDRAAVDAASAAGMGEVRRLVRIELPLAWPIVLAGVRVATQLVIGVAVIAAIVGGPGLGGEIYTNGIRRIGSPGALDAIVGGTLAVLALAVLFDLAYLAIGRLTIPRGLRD